MESKVILITGYDRCGKDYLANKLSQYLDADIVHLADSLKDIVCDLLDTEREELENLKNSPYAYIDIEYNYDGVRKSQTIGFRAFIIRVASAIRNNISKNVFIESVKNKIRESNKEYIIVPDARFLLEYEELSKDFDLYSIRLESKLDTCGKNGERYEVDLIPYDCVFTNTKDERMFTNYLEELVEKIKNHYEKEETNE